MGLGGSCIARRLCIARHLVLEDELDFPRLLGVLLAHALLLHVTPIPAGASEIILRASLASTPEVLAFRYRPWAPRSEALSGFCVLNMILYMNEERQAPSRRGAVAIPWGPMLLLHWSP